VGWGVVGGVLVVMQILVPAVIMPWFNTFSPLEKGTLSTEIASMAERAGFPVRSVTVMDGSRRSTKANAFFVGIGHRRRIALFDTLLERYSTDEILGVLAHEIGHYRLGHVRLGVAVSLFETGLLLFLFSRLGQLPALSGAFGVAEPSVYAGIVFFALLIRPLELLLSVGQLALSRRNESAADAFASRLAGGSSGLARALLQLYRESLGELWPHPLTVALGYSHPPLVERLKALAGRGAA
jgi:STE24 endopeptidase